MAEKPIRGAVSVGDKTFVAGQEKEFAEAVKENNRRVAEHNKKGGKLATEVDLDVLTEKGALGDAEEELTPPVNMQRTEKGKRVENEGVHHFPAGRQVPAGRKTERAAASAGSKK